MEIQQDFRDLLALFNEREVSYAIVGGYALAYHGAPRYTGDIDLLVEPDPDNAQRVVDALAEFGFGSLGLTAEDFSIMDRVIQLGYPLVRVESQGSTDLAPERMVFFEVAHTGQLDRFKTTAAAFHYRLRDGVTLSVPTFNVSEEQELEVSSSLINQGEARAWGGEVGVEILIREQVTGSFNYSYQRLSGEVDRQTAAAGMPHHKFNGGLRLRRGRFDFDTAIHWVDRTLWSNNQTTGTSPFLVEVDSYTLLNLHLGYRFGGRLQDLEVGLDIFNVLGNDHFETLRETAPATPGQGGEIIRSRQTLKLSYTL